MSDELERLASQVREGLTRGDAPSLSAVLRGLGVSPENQEHLRSLLSGLGYSDSQLSDVEQMTKIVEGFLLSMPPDARKQIMDMMSQVVVDMSGGNLPPEVTGFLSAIGGGDGAAVRRSEEHASAPSKPQAEEGSS